MARWDIATHTKKQVEELAGDLKIHETTAKLLLNRGLDTREKIELFLKKSKEMLHDPFLMSDMEAGIDRVNAALVNGEKAMIYGDYDVDGISSTCIMYIYLCSIGLDVCYHIPDRLEEGYGINKEAVKKAKENSIGLIVTVDTGITAAVETEYAKSLGIDVIITDHHECLQTLPGALAVINPKRAGDAYPFKELAGAGVALKFILAHNAKYGGHGDSADFDCYYEFAAMGTVADIMTLTDENRVLVDCGLKKMGNSKNFGINAILEGYFKNKSKKNISTDVIGFYISPRINAAGRLSQANRAVELFLSKNRRLASVIAEELSVLNRQRQETEREIFAQAENELSHVANRDKKKIIILCSDNWHQGVIGIVASKLSERHNKTFILFAKDAGGVYKGSCRSAKNINIADLLARCSDILIKYGGHEHAAGLSAQYENIAELDRRLNELADLANAEGEAENLLEIDCEIKACDVDCDMVREFELLEPFGTDNPVPSFALSNCKILHITPIGENRHIRLDFSQGDSFFEAVYFGMEAERFAFGKHEYVDVACNIEINEFASKQKVQYIVRDVRPEASHEKKYLAEKENYINFKDGGTGFIFNKSDLPDKEDFKSVYLFLSGNFKKEVSYDNVQSMNKLQLLYFDQSKRAISKFKFRIILDIFAEMGLICLEHDFDSVKKIKINHQDKKIDLNDSAIYSRLKSLNF